MPTSIYVVYKHTCAITNKSYIGQTNNINRRTQHHRSPSSECTAFNRAIQKYGWDTFTTEILAENLTLDEANIMEEHFIANHNTLVPDGYNLKSGGLNQLMCEEVKRKISIANKGKSKPPRTEEHCRKLSESHKGRTQSAETIQKRTAKTTGQTRSSETKLKMSEAQLNRVQSDEERRKKDENRARLAERRRGTKLSPESIAKRTATQRANREARAANSQPSQ